MDAHTCSPHVSFLESKLEVYVCIHALSSCHAKLAGSPRSSSSGPPTLELLLGRQIGRGSQGRVHASIFRGQKVAVKACSWVS